MNASFHFRFHLESSVQFYVDAGSRMIHEIETVVWISVYVGGFISGFIWKLVFILTWTPASKQKSELHTGVDFYVDAGVRFENLWKQTSSMLWTPISKSKHLWKPASTKHSLLYRGFIRTIYNPVAIQETVRKSLVKSTVHGLLLEGTEICNYYVFVNKNDGLNTTMEQPTKRNDMPSNPTM